MGGGELPGNTEATCVLISSRVIVADNVLINQYMDQLCMYMEASVTLMPTYIFQGLLESYNIMYSATSRLERSIVQT